MIKNIQKTEAFIKEKFLNADGLDGFDGKYRYEHTLRTAEIGRRIARAEGFDEEALVIACLLHDIGYIECKTEEDHNIHGKISARIANDFLASIGLEPERIKTICYGIKIHTEAKEEYERVPTPFEVSVADADNIDRFGAYRLYLNLCDFFQEEMTQEQIIETAKKRIEGYEWYINFKCGTNTGAKLWKDIIGFQLEYFKRLKEQMENMGNFCNELIENE